MAPRARQAVVTPLPPALQRWLTQPDPVTPVIVASHDQAELRDVVSAAAAQLLCQATSGNTPCHTCAGCRLYTSNHHPDFIWLETEKTTVSISQVRHALQQLHQRPISPHRLVVIWQAEKLSLPAATTLLKSLEEPATATRFLLATPWPRRLLPTIRSRSQPIRLTPAPTTTTERESPLAVSDLFTRLTSHPKKSPLTPDELADITAELSRQLRAQGASPQLLRAFMRLRDYHYIAENRGNTSLARDVLLASLP